MTTSKPILLCHALAVALAIMLAAIAAGHPALADVSLAGVASVIDGDTLEIHETRIRLHGIDAPESAQHCERPNGERWRCGQWAALALADRVGRATVGCEARERDRYRRVVAVCFQGDVDLNRWLVERGWAAAYRRYATDYIEDEESARAERRGIWAGPFVMPWDWRRGKWLAVQGEDASRDGCRLKGNISRV